MNIALSAAAFIGFLAVTQSILNRNIAQSLGLAKAVLLNGVINSFMASIFLAISYKYSHKMPQIFDVSSRVSEIKWWYFLPGVFGFLIVAFYPYAIDKIGAAKVIVSVVASQVIVAMLFDYFLFKLEIGGWRYFGAFLVVIGVWLTVWKK